jgi:hypothetical protein
MFSFAKFACTAALIGFLPSCATIIKQGTGTVSVQSQPSGLDFVVKDSEGNVAGSGVTPGSVKLQTGNGYFRPATYTIQTKRGGKVVGEQTITSNVSGWYFGNILIGGLVGMLIVDPLTGAMYALPENVEIPGSSTASANGRSLTVASIDTLTTEQRSKLVRL